jgi:hypothetical protein
MVRRAACLVDTSDVTRPIRDPARISSYTIEELRSLCGIWLPLLWYGNVSVVNDCRLVESTLNLHHGMSILCLDNESAQTPAAQRC